MALNWDSIDQFRNNRKLDWNAIDEYRTKKSYDPVSSAAKAPTQSQLIVTDRTSKIQSAQNMLSYYQSSLQSIRDQYSTETITRNLDDLWNKYDEWKSLGNTKMADYTLSEIERYNTAVRNRALDIGRERETENKIKAYEDLIKKYEDDIKFANKVYSTEESVYSRPDFESTSSDTSRKKVPDDYLQDVIDTITGHFNPALLTGGTTLGGGTVNKHFEANQEAQKLSDTQKKTLLYLASKGEWQTAKSYFEALKPLLNELQTQSLITEMTEMPGGEILARAGGAVAAPFAYAEVGLSALTGKDVDMSQGAIGAVRASSEVSAIKSEDRSKAANFFIETGASIAQNLANVLIFGPSALAAMGLQAAGTDAVQQLMSGKTASQAFGHGTLMGTLEVLTEKLPLDNLLDTVNAVGKGLTKNAAIGLLKSAAKQAGIEFAEETINQYAQTLTDIAYYGDDSDYKKYIAQLENEGKSHSQAVKEANLKFFVEEPLTSGLQGMTSGFLMGSGAATISEIRTDRFVGDVMKSLPVETVQKLTGQSAEGMSERQLVALANKIGITEDIISLGTAYANASQAAKNVTRALNEYVRTGADNALNAFESAQHTLEASQKEIARINEKLGIDIGGTVNEILDERQERDGSLDTGGEAGTVATVPTEGADAGRTGTGEVVSPETAGTLISSREIGFDNGTDNKTISIVTELNDELKGIADNFSARGYAVVYFTGDMEVAEKGKVFNVRGAVKGNTVYLRYDHPTVSVQQVADHEEFHIIKKTNPKIIKDIAIRILKTHTQAEMESMLQKYARVYGRVYGNIDAIVEEMLADAYAGINAYGATASEYQTEARSVASELTAEPTVRGPPVADATRKLSPEQAQLLNIYASNIETKADHSEVDLTEYYEATRNVNAFSPTVQDAAIIADALESVVEQFYDSSIEEGYIEKIREMIDEPESEAEEFSDSDVRYSIRETEPPKKTGIAYKVFMVKDGQLYPPMVANPGGAGTPVGVWLDADVGELAEPSKTGRPQVRSGGKGTSTGKGTLAYRPGWHLGDIPHATQFAKVNPETGKKELFPANFVWAECEYAMDIDYQEEAMSYGYTESGKFRHAYAGLPRIPVDGYYRYRTNPRPDTVPWIISGAMKVNRILTDEETNAICREAGVEPLERQGGPIRLEDYGLKAGDIVNLYSLDSDSVDETDQINMDFGAFFAELAVGDAESQRKISKFRTNTLENITIFDEAERQNESLAKELFGYDSITERESITAAKERLNTDLDGEIEFLTNNTDWSGEDLDTAMGILAYYTREARTTGNSSKVGEWARLIRPRGTKGGRFIQAFAKYSRTPQGILVKAADTLGDTPNSDQILATMAQFADELELVQDGDIDSLVDVIVKMAKVRNTPVSRTILNRLKGMTDFKYLYDFALRQFENISTDYLKVDFGRKLSTVQTLAQLLNLRTGLTNILSNQLFDPLASFANNVALIPDAIMSIFTHKRMVGFQKSYLSKAKWREAVDAYRRASVEVSLDVDVSSTKSKYGTSARRTYKRIGNLAERTLSNLEKVMGYELNATDEFLKGSVFAEVMESLSRNVEKGYMTEEEAAEWATQEALYRSFQDDTIIGKILREIKGALNVIGFGDTGDGANKKLKRHTFGVGDLVTKYAQVPGALITRAIEFSPLGYVKAIVALAGAKNNPGFQRGAALAIGRATTGTGLIIAFAALAASGMLKRDDLEDNKDIAAQKSAEGMRGAQLNITGISRWINGEDPEWQPGDVAIDVGNLEPINYIMTIGSLIAQDESNKSFLSKLKDNTIDSLYLAISDLSMMQTISSIANAIKYHDEESDLSLVAEIAIELGQNSVTGFIPSLIRQLAQATDEYYREQYSSRDPWQQLGDKVKSVLPGLRQTLPEKLTPYGEAKTYPNPWLNALNAFMFPGSISIYEPAAVTNELELVRDVTGRVDMFPARNAPYTVRFGGQKYTLTDDERRTYQITRGTLTATLQETIINSRAYREASPDTRADILADAVDYANDLAMREYASNNGIIYTSKTWNKTIEAMQDGADFAAFRKFEADTQGMTKQAEYIEYLSTLNYSDKVMAALYKSVVSDSRAADIDLCMKTGLTFDEYLSAHQKYIELDANKNLTATQKRREFVYWARQFDYEQIAALDEAFSFSFGSKAQEGKYDEFLNQGLSAQNAYDLANKLDDIEPTEGRAGISNSQRYQVIAQSNMSESEKEKALSVLMDEKAYEKYKAARDLDIPTATYIDIITAVGAMSGEDKRDQVYQYLSAHLETYAQKYSMWLALGYAESTFGKYRW